MRNVVLLTWAVMIAGCCQLRTTTIGQAVQAEIEVIGDANVPRRLPNVRLTLRNAGRERVFVPQWRGAFFGKLIVECQGKSIELRHKDLWESLLTGLFVPEMKPLRPGESVSYDLAVQNEFQSLDDLKRQKVVRPQGAIIGVNGATLEALDACKQYQICCVVDQLKATSNKITIQQR